MAPSPVISSARGVQISALKKASDSGVPLTDSTTGFERTTETDMVTDDERREVARRLRDEAAHGEMHIRDFLGALCACIKTGRNAYRALLLLADLIEPSEPKVRCVAEVKVDGERIKQLVHDAAVELAGIDRDALLALADEMERIADENRMTGMMGIGRARSWADRIREALGVADA